MRIKNKRAFFDYELLDKFEAGINLLGQEVKAVRLGHADLSGSFVKIRGSEAYLINSKIYPYQYARSDDYDPKRTRKLLLHKSQIVSLKSKTEPKNLTIVPVSLYTTKAYIKLEIAVGKSKKSFDKRASIKKKDQKRALEQELKSVY